MPAPQISSLPPAPSRADDGPTFSAKADAFVAALPEFVSQANTQADYVDAKVEAALDAGLEDAADNAAAATDAAAQTALDRASTTLSATIAGDARDHAVAAADDAALSYAGTLAAAGLSGAKPYATLALANADLGSLVTDQVVFIANVGEYYQYNGVSLVFLRAQEYYTSPTTAVASDSVQNTLTKLLVATGMIPAAAPSLTLGV